MKLGLCPGDSSAELSERLSSHLGGEPLALVASHLMKFPSSLPLRSREQWKQYPVLAS